MNVRADFPSENDAFEFNTQLRRLTTPAACADLFRAAIAPYGFDTFACGEVDVNLRERNVFYIIDWPDSWRKFYMEAGLLNRDPVVDALAYRQEPFTWTDLRADRQLAKLGRTALDLVAGHGWVEGLVVPLPRGKDRYGLVSLVGHQTIIEPAVRAYLCLISICLHNHVRTLVPHEGFALPPAGLTPREVECVRLVARGLSDNAIAKTIGVAPSTAHEFVEKAKRRLVVNSRAEMTAVAVSLGIIDI